MIHNPVITMNSEAESIVTYLKGITSSIHNFNAQRRLDTEPTSLWADTETFTTDSNETYIRVDMNDNGYACAVWVLANGKVMSSYSADAGVNWGNSVQISKDTDICSCYDVKVFPDNSAMAIWIDTVGNEVQTRYTNTSGVWQGSSSTPTILNQQTGGTSVMYASIGITNYDGNNYATAVWRSIINGDSVICTNYTHTGGSGWGSTTDQIISTTSEYNATWPSVVMNGLTAVAVWGYGNDGPYIYDQKVQYRRSTNGGSSWGTIGDLMPDYTSAENNAKIVMNSSGETVVIFLANDGTYDNVQINTSDDGGATWDAAPTTISDGSVNTQYANVSISSTGLFLTSWSDIDNEQVQSRAGDFTDPPI